MPTLSRLMLATSLLAIGLVQPADARKTHYGIIDKFGPNQNPHGAWSWLTNEILLGTYKEEVEAVVSLNGWTNGMTGSSLATVARNYMKNHDPIQSLQYTIPSRYLFLDPGTQPKVMVRFTAPATGLYHLRGAFLGDDKREQSHLVEIRQNGVAFQTYTMAAYEQDTKFRFPLSLTAGDTVEFVCDTAGDGTHLATGVAANFYGP